MECPCAKGVCHPWALREDAPRSVEFLPAELDKPGPTAERASAEGGEEKGRCGGDVSAGGRRKSVTVETSAGDESATAGNLICERQINGAPRR